jgi:hypothetical protein
MINIVKFIQNNLLCMLVFVYLRVCVNEQRLVERAFYCTLSILYRNYTFIYSYIVLSIDC